jgi:hypothetical protein
VIFFLQRSEMYIFCLHSIVIIYLLPSYNQKNILTIKEHEMQYALIQASQKESEKKSHYLLEYKQSAQTYTTSKHPTTECICTRDESISESG